MSDLLILIIMSVFWNIKHINKICDGIFLSDGF